MIASTITAPSLDLRATKNIIEAAGGGLVATTLTGQAASVSLTAGNQVSVLGAFAPANGFSFQNVGDLTVAGPITSSSGDVAITVHAGLGQAGTLMLDAPVGAGGSVTLTSDAALTQASGATINAGPSATLTSGAAIVIGDALAASTVALAASGDITETGSVATGLLTLHAGIAPSGAGAGTLGSALLAGGANRIAALGDSAVTGNLVLADTQDLAVNGTVATGLAQLGTATAGQRTFGATLAAPGSTITVAGALSAGGPGAVGGDVSNHRRSRRHSRSGQRIAGAERGRNRHGPLERKHHRNGLALGSRACRVRWRQRVVHQRQRRLGRVGVLGRGRVHTDR